MFLIIICLLITLHLLLVIVDKTYVYRALYYNYVDTDDYKIFHNKTIVRSQYASEWTLSEDYNQKQLSPATEALLDSLETLAVLVIKNDKLYFEKYYQGYNENTLSNSFSVAKSFVSALVGIALTEGKIKGIDQPVSDYLKGFDRNGKEKITIRHLLTMSSGLNWDETYANLFSITTEAYYGRDLEKIIQKLKVVEEPGKIFRYKGCDTQILSFIIKQATGMSVAEYATEKLWKPLGCTSTALWSMDRKDGNEKAYCCINATARDFARLAKLYMQKGTWNNDTIIAPSYIESSLSPILLKDGESGGDSPVDYYGYQWWLLPGYKGSNIFYARGILGQYIIAIPEQKKIIVRLGKKRGPKIGHHYKEMLTLIDECYAW
ncbi:MAG: beta-lactamase family protein [Cytophagaceae bacterium]|nr:beta-lactamase family protein [Cytophagaceae bacterium]MDW8455233.1 serine hydrolase [Cytophagaceae bacterium]